MYNIRINLCSYSYNCITRSKRIYMHLYSYIYNIMCLHIYTVTYSYTHIFIYIYIYKRIYTYMLIIQKKRQTLSQFFQGAAITTKVCITRSAALTTRNPELSLRVVKQIEYVANKYKYIYIYIYMFLEKQMHIYIHLYQYDFYIGYVLYTS